MEGRGKKKSAFPLKANISCSWNEIPECTGTSDAMCWIANLHVGSRDLLGLQRIVQTTEIISCVMYSRHTL